MLVVLLINYTSWIIRKIFKFKKNFCSNEFDYSILNYLKGSFFCFGPDWSFTQVYCKKLNLLSLSFSMSKHPYQASKKGCACVFVFVCPVQTCLEQSSFIFPAQRAIRVSESYSRSLLVLRLVSLAGICSYNSIQTENVW